jgi:hypothetical protein
VRRPSPASSGVFIVLLAAWGRHAWGRPGQRRHSAGQRLLAREEKIHSSHRAVFSANSSSLQSPP